MANTLDCLPIAMTRDFVPFTLRHSQSLTSWLSEVVASCHSETFTFCHPEGALRRCHSEPFASCHCEPLPSCHSERSEESHGQSKLRKEPHTAQGKPRDGRMSLGRNTALEESCLGQTLRDTGARMRQGKNREHPFLATYFMFR